jgi:callose synthase
MSAFVIQAIISGSRTAENLQIFYRFFQGFFFLLILAGLIVTVALTPLSTSDVFASILALVPTGWGILSVSICLVGIQTEK